MKSYGYLLDSDLIIADEMALGSKDFTNMIEVGGNTNGSLCIEVRAHTALTVLTTKAFNIEVEVYTADTVGSAAAPIANSHMYLIHKTSADGALSVAAGDLIAEMIVPCKYFGANTWLNLKCTTDDTLTAKTVDAFARLLT